jgi:hypothetical protein
VSRFLIAVTASLLVSTAAYAVPPTITATLSAASAKSAIVSDHTVWKCDGTTCTTHSIPRESNTVSECKVLAQKSGATVTAYATATDSFDADHLAKCNAKD